MFEGKLLYVLCLGDRGQGMLDTTASSPQENIQIILSKVLNWQGRFYQ